eukprot:jgi/Bigna1/72368/fgenesh1_pg.19_\
MDPLLPTQRHPHSHMAKSRVVTRVIIIAIVSATAIYIHRPFSKDVLSRGASTQISSSKFPVGMKGRMQADTGSMRVRLARRSKLGNVKQMDSNQYIVGTIFSGRSTSTHAYDSAHQDESFGEGGLGKGRFSRESRIDAFPSRVVSVKAGETVRGGGTIREKHDKSIARGFKPANIPDGFASISQSINNVADNTADFFAGLSPKTCSSSMDCRREHAFDNRVGYECCSYGVVNMCCFPPEDDDDDWKGGWGRPLVPELQLVPIPIRKHNPDVYGGPGHHGGYPY